VARAQHLALLEKELENIDTIAAYLDTISPPVARDLMRWQVETSSRFKELRQAADAAALQAWVTQDLVPLLRRSEQAAHLVATTVRVDPRKTSAPFAWPVSVHLALKDAAIGTSDVHPGRRR
jgi:hypothetical protein